MKDYKLVIRQQGFIVELLLKLPNNYRDDIKTEILVCPVNYEHLLEVENKHQALVDYIGRLSSTELKKFIKDIRDPNVKQSNNKKKKTKEKTQQSQVKH